MSEARDWFSSATHGFLEVVGRVRPEHLDQPGLGEWDVRALLGHTTRAFLTIETYLVGDAADLPTGLTAVEYYQAARPVLREGSGIAERGRQAGRDLGEDPVGAAQQIARRVLSLVSRTRDDAVLTTPFGTMALGEYLRTRAFELTVHSIDLARAVDAPVPGLLRAACRPAICLAAAAGTSEQAVDALLALTGRRSLPPGFSVL